MRRRRDWGLTKEGTNYYHHVALPRVWLGGVSLCPAVFANQMYAVEERPSRGCLVPGTSRMIFESVETQWSLFAVRWQ